MTHDVFISYSSRDKAVADALCATLEGRKIRCWIAPRDVPPGQTWAGAIVDAISQSRACVLVLSDGSNRSEQVVREVGEAVDRGIPIVPFRVEDIEPTKDLRYYIRSIHWLDALTPPLERHLEILADSVQGLLAVCDRKPVGVVASSEPATTREVIQEGPADRRPAAPEWKSGELQVLGYHGSAVDVVAVSTDGSRAVTGSSDRTLKVWDVNTGTELFTLAGHDDDIRALAVTQDGKQVYSASADGAVIVWDLETGAQLRTLELDTRKHAPLAAVTLAPQGQRAVATSSRGPTHLTWDLERGRLLYSTSHSSLKPAIQRTLRLTMVTTTPDKRRTAVASSEPAVKVRVEQIRRVLSLRGLTCSVIALTLTPSGRRVVAGSEDGTLTVWDLVSDGELLTTTEKGREATVEASCSLSGHTEAVTAVAVTPDGRRAVSGSRDETIRVWDLSSDEMAATYEVEHPVRCVALSQGDKEMRIVAGDAGGRVLLLDLEEQMQATHQSRRAVVPDSTTPEVLKDQGLEAPAAEVSGRQDGSGPGEARSGLGELLTLGRHGGSVNSVALTPDGRQAVSGSANQTLKLWDLESRTALRTLTGHSEEVLTVAVTLDGQRAFSAAADGEILLWDLNTGDQEIVKPKTGYRFLSVCVAPHGRRAVRLFLGHHLRRLRAFMDVFDLYRGPVYWQDLWEGGPNPASPTIVAWALSADGQRLVRAREHGIIQSRGLKYRDRSVGLEGHSDAVSALAITPDAQRVVSGSYDRTVRVWDLPTARQLAILEGHTDAVMVVAIADNGRSAVSAGRDKTLMVWNLDTCQAITTVRTDYPVRCCAIAQDADGLSIVAGDAGGQVGLLRLGSTRSSRTV